MSIVKRAPMVAAGIVALAMSSAAFAEAIIVRSTGPSAASYPVGSRLAATERVVLRAGDRVVLVGEGPSRTLNGPGNFPVRSTGQVSQTNTSTLGRYLSATGSTIRRTGAVRGTTATSTPPNLWVVDIAKAGTMCVTDPANVTLWRGDMTEDTLLTVENAANPEQRSSLAFVAGQNFRAWPSDVLPISSGTSYRITGPGMTEGATLNFVAVSGEVPDDAESVASMLLQNGCTAQLEQLGSYLADN